MSGFGWMVGCLGFNMKGFISISFQYLLKNFFWRSWALSLFEADRLLEHWKKCVVRKEEIVSLVIVKLHLFYDAHGVCRCRSFKSFGMIKLYTRNKSNPFKFPNLIISRIRFASGIYPERSVAADFIQYSRHDEWDGSERVIRSHSTYTCAITITP